MTNDSAGSTAAPLVLVRPARGEGELRWLLLFSTVIIFLCAMVIASGRKLGGQAELQPWQINAFQELRPEELGTFNALRTAALEIDDVHEDGGVWMDILDMQSLVIPPFVRDAAWRRQGRMGWEMRIPVSEKTDMALYLGVPKDFAVSGSFLLVMLHEHVRKQGNTVESDQQSLHPRYEIWHTNSTSVQFPEIVTDQALISAGWKEVVALTGSDEIERMKGGTQS